MLVKASAKVELPVPGLFIHLTTEERRLNQDLGSLAVIPMALPTAFYDTSLGKAEALAAEHKNRNDNSSSRGMVEQSFLVASRDGHAQISDNGVPEGFVWNTTSLVHDLECDPTLLKQMCNRFSRHGKVLTGLKSKPTTMEDQVSLNDIIARARGKINQEEGSGIDTDCPIRMFARSLSQMQELISSGVTFEDFCEVAEDSEPARCARHKSTAYGRLLARQLASTNEEVIREKLCYIKFSMLLQQLCPIFLSPVGGSHEIIAEVIVSSGMTSRTSDVKVPHLLLPEGINKDEGKQMAPGGQLVMVTICGPKETTNSGLTRAIRMSHQASVMRSRSIGAQLLSIKSTSR